MFSSKTLLLLAFAVLPAAQAIDPSFQVHGVDFSAVTTPQGSASARQALVNDGIVAITLVPELASVRADVMTAVGACAIAMRGMPDMTAPQREFYMDDGTARLTVAAAAGDDFNITDAQADAVPACDVLRKTNEQYRDIIGLVSSVLAGTALPELGVAAASKKQQLDHAHVYMIHDSDTKQASELTSTSNNNQAEASLSRRLGAQQTRKFSLDLHTDHGLAVAFTPAVVVDVEGTMRTDMDSGALWVRPAGLSQPHIAVFPCGEANDCVVFMLGDAAEDLTGADELHGLPHAMTMPRFDDSNNNNNKDDAITSDTLEGAGRVWFGRMFLPVNVGEHVPVPGYEGIACSGREFRLLQHTASSQADCTGDQTFCWNKCLANPASACVVGKEPTCANPELVVWTSGDDHCTDCTVQCVSPAVSRGNGFCSGLVTNMYMDGFNGVGNNQRSCLVFLIRELRMDSWWTFLLGCLAALLLGVFTEYLISYRRKLNNLTAERDQTLGLRLRKVTLYTFAVFIGYIDMLLAMTYSTLIFIMVILGLGIGHFLFNLQAPVGESMDPCCQGEVGSSDLNGAVKPIQNGKIADVESADSEADANNDASVSEAAVESPSSCCAEDAAESI